MTKRIYIAGPMTGHPDFNYPAFHAEAARLRAIGYLVENPAENPQQVDWQSYMRVAIAQLVKCDAIALLPGWENSRGALIENGLAVSLDIPVRKAAEYQALQPKADCWMCEGAGVFHDEQCGVCMELWP